MEVCHYWFMSRICHWLIEYNQGYPVCTRCIFSHLSSRWLSLPHIPHTHCKMRRISIIGLSGKTRFVKCFAFKREFLYHQSWWLGFQWWTIKSIKAWGGYNKQADIQTNCIVEVLLIPFSSIHSPFALGNYHPVVVYILIVCFDSPTTWIDSHIC